MVPTTASDVHSEDSVFRRLFSDEQKPRKVTKADRMAQIFAEAPTRESVINVNEFLPSY